MNINYLSYNPTFELISLRGNSAQSLSVDDTGDQTGDILPEGLYVIWATESCVIKIAPDALTGLTATNGFPIPSDVIIGHFVFDGECKLGGITASGASTIYYHKVTPQ